MGTISTASSRPIHLWTWNQSALSRSFLDRCTPSPLLGVRPAAQQIVIEAGQAHDLAIAMAAVRGDGLDRLVEVEEQGARAVVTDHRLYPEKARQPRATHHRFDPVQAGGRIEQQGPGRQLRELGAGLCLRP